MKLGWADNGEIVIRVDPRYFRPAEVDTLLVSQRKQKWMTQHIRRISSRND